MSRIYEVHAEMAPLFAFRPQGGGRMRLFKKDSDAPDYTPMANASEKAAELGYELGNKQLDESKRQYEENMGVIKPIIDAQTGLMNQSIAQGNDYYEYMKTNQRPVEAALNADAMASGGEAKQNEAAAQAEADSLRGLTKSQNIMVRQGLRYGLSPAALKKASEGLSATAASNIASAAGTARQKEEAEGYAKKMDVAGLYRNLTGASQGAYGLALNAGNSASGNQMAPGQALMNGMAQGNGTIMQGSGQNIQGLSGILNSQTSTYNSNSGSDVGGILGGIGGLAAGAAKLWALSSKKFKEDKKPIDGELVVERLQHIPVDAWKYKDGIADGGEHVGPYAEDVHREFGDAAAPGANKLDLVTMNGLALSAVKSLADRMDRVEQNAGLKRKG